MDGGSVSRGRRVRAAARVGIRLEATPSDGRQCRRVSRGRRHGARRRSRRHDPRRIRPRLAPRRPRHRRLRRRAASGGKPRAARRRAESLSRVPARRPRVHDPVPAGHGLAGGIRSVCERPGAARAGAALRPLRPGADAPRVAARALLDYAWGQHVKLVAYVYPVLPFAGNPAWLVRAAGDSTHWFASLGVRALQDWLIDKLVAFHRRTGIGGYAFDHTLLIYNGTSRYAQWWGWRRVTEELKRRVPEIVIDGRQAYQNYGPWSWLAGSYPHPTSTDEQPESFVPFPDLSFDRVSADRERYTAYRYRLYEFAPSEIVPGFIGHQTSRSDDSGDMPSERTADRGVVLKSFRARDWDYLGWRYSLISSIAIAGWNNVIDMIPARDSAENAR